MSPLPQVEIEMPIAAIELWPRIEKLLREIAANDVPWGPPSEAQRIVELLPWPIDPDMVAAREVVCEQHHDRHMGSPWHDNQAERVRSGADDNSLVVNAAYHSIKRGRELERGQ